MSKASRMFRTRSNRGGNLAVRPTAQPDVARCAEADLSSCLAAMYNSSASAFLEEVYAEITPVAPFAGQPSAASGDHALLSFTAKSVADAAESDDVLAILLQTIEDSAVQSNDFSSAAAVVAATFQEDATIIAADSTDLRRAELFIVEKPVAAVRAAVPFLTEVMDLEAIAASARESATGTASNSSECADGENPRASEVVAEMSAVAEE